METNQAVRVTWPDGKVTEARSAAEFLLRGAAEQWSETSFQQMKDQYSKRALALTGKFIHPFQPDESFLRELGRVGFFGVEFV